MKHISLLLVFSLFIGHLSASAQDFLRVHVSDTISGSFAVAVTVKVVDSNGEHAGVTNEFGVVDFDGLLLAEPSVPGEYPTLMLETESNGYLPQRKELKVGPNSWYTELSLVPRKFGYMTPVISAAKGGKFKLPNLGLLSVKAGALEGDARLWLSVIPNAAQSGVMVEALLEYELWCVALDPDGYPQPGTLPFLPGDVNLSVRLPNNGGPVEDLKSETWSAHSFDENWLPLLTTQIAATEEADDILVELPIMEGFNLVERDYRTVAQEAGCSWHPWAIELILVGITPVLGTGQSQNVYCGRYSENDCLTIEEGEELITEWEGGVELETTTGIEAGGVFASASASLGVTLSGSYGETKVTGRTLGRKRCKTSGQPINGDPSPTPPWSCVDGAMEMTKTVATYEIFAIRWCIPETGPPIAETSSGGLISVPGPLINDWTNVSINTGCPGCDTDPPQQVPPNLPK